MGLINLKTDLKSLKYGKDRVGGGSSQQPFIQKAIPDGFGAVGNTGGLDVFTRGGSLVFEKTADDTSRLSKLLLTTNTFQGPAFSIKQNVLSRQSVQTQASPKGLNQGPYIPTSTIAQATVSATGLHFNTFGLNPVPGSPGSLVTYSDVVTSQQDQASNRLVQFTDNFVNKKTSGNTLYSYPGGPGSFLGFNQTTITIPNNQRTGINTAGTTLDSFFGREGVRNPTYQIYNELVSPDIEIPNSPNVPEYLVPPIPSLKYQAFTNPRSVELDYRRYLSLSYNAGVATVGSEQVRNRLVFRDNNLINLKTAPKGDKPSGVVYDIQSRYAGQNNLTGSLYFIPVSQSAFLTPGPDVSLIKLVGTSNLVNQKPAYDTANVPDYLQTYDTIQKYGVTNQEEKLFSNVNDTNVEPTDFRTFVTNNVVKNSAYDAARFNRDTTFKLGMPGSKTAKGTEYSYSIAGTDLINNTSVNTTAPYLDGDLAPFLIKYYNYDGADQYIQFRAFVTNFSDNYNSDWSSFKYLGRGEDFYTYNGFSREIALSFKVHAQSKIEMAGQYTKLNYLASLMTPNYSSAGYMRGNFVEITFGDYLVATPGIITSLAYSIPDESPWEIGRNNFGTFTSDKKLPHLIDVTSFTFKPIHSFVPQVNQQYIAGALKAGNTTEPSGPTGLSAGNR
jgi:hypothetical protein